MSRAISKLIVFIFVSAFVSGCATVSDALRSKDDGIAETYPVGFNDAWRAARTALRWEDAETIEEHKDDYYMVTTISRGFWSSGSAIAVWVEPIDDENTKVTMVSRRRVQTNLATGLTETTFHSRFQQAVDMIKAGTPLTPFPPELDNNKE